MKELIVLLLSGAMLFACNRGVVQQKKQLRCAKKSSYKQKNYKVKRNKKVVYSAGGGSGSSSSSSPKQDSQQTSSDTRNQKTDTVKTSTTPVPVAKLPPPINQDDVAADIPDLKVPSFEREEKIIEFKGKEIDLTDEDFSYDEVIEFIDLSDLFVDREESLTKLKELAKLLRKDNSLQLTIIGNTATTMPKGDVKYGSTEEVLKQTATLNTEEVTIKDVMLARAKRVYNLLVSQSVNPNQLNIQTGSHRQWESERTVTFILGQ